MLQMIANPSAPTRATALRNRIHSAALNAVIDAYGALLSLNRRLHGALNLRSRRGEGNMIWTILVVGLVAVVAAVSIYQFGPKIKAMGEKANQTLSAPPW
ncbi:MAG: hypothetical protein HC853_08040 [Anaerolineae bacterium]|nr:hypothetical protein [Anaerolineae bacterium]